MKKTVQIIACDNYSFDIESKLLTIHAPVIFIMLCNEEDYGKVWAVIVETYTNAFNHVSNAMVCPELYTNEDGIKATHWKIDNVRTVFEILDI